MICRVPGCFRLGGRAVLRFDRVLVGPTLEELRHALAGAVDAGCFVGEYESLGEMQFLGQGAADRLLVCVTNAAGFISTAEPRDGWRQWNSSDAWGAEAPGGTSRRALGELLPLARVGLAWWTDHIGRRHYRVVGWRGRGNRAGQDNFLCPFGEPRPPLWLVYPDRTFFRREGKDRVLTAVCPCGVAGAPDELGWMGDRCGPCHDRAESGSTAPRFWEQTTFSVPEASIENFAGISPDGRLLVVGSGRGPVGVWDTSTGRPVLPPCEVAPPVEGMILCASFTPDGKALGVAVPPGLGLLETGSWKARALPRLPELQWARRLAFSPDGSLLAALTQQLLLVEVETGRPRHALRGPLDDLSCLAFAPDGRTVAAGTRSGALRVWDVASGAEVAGLDLPSHLLAGLAFAPGGRTLAVATVRTDPPETLPLRERGKVVLWAVGRGSVVVPLPGHALGALAVAYSPDGKSLATGGCDRMVRLWGAATGRAKGCLEWHFGDVRQVAFSADGRWLVSMSEDGVVKLWPWDVVRQF